MKIGREMMFKKDRKRIDEVVCGLLHMKYNIITENQCDKILTKVNKYTDKVKKE